MLALSSESPEPFRQAQGPEHVEGLVERTRKEVLATREHKNPFGYGNGFIAPIGAQMI
jgi:hypothetical protein